MNQTRMDSATRGPAQLAQGFSREAFVAGEQPAVLQTGGPVE